MKTIGIAAHSAEGAGLCFLTTCRVGGELLGEHMHPRVVLGAVPMGLSMPGWRANDLAQVEPYLVDGGPAGLRKALRARRGAQLEPLLARRDEATEASEIARIEDAIAVVRRWYVEEEKRISGSLF